MHLKTIGISPVLFVLTVFCFFLDFVCLFFLLMFCFFVVYPILFSGFVDIEKTLYCLGFLICLLLRTGLSRLLDQKKSMVVDVT